MDEEGIAFTITLMLGVIIGGLVFGCGGERKGKRETQVEAVDHKAAHYSIIDDQGHTKFVWNDEVERKSNE